MRTDTRRHLCEFTGLDLEMAIQEHYNEALEVCVRVGIGYRHRLQDIGMWYRHVV